MFECIPSAAISTDTLRTETVGSSVPMATAVEGTSLTRRLTCVGAVLMSVVALTSCTSDPESPRRATETEAQPLATPAMKPVEPVGPCSDKMMETNPDRCIKAMTRGNAAIVTFNVTDSIAKALSEKLENRVRLATYELAHVEITIIPASPEAVQKETDSLTTEGCIEDDSPASSPSMIVTQLMSHETQGYDFVIALSNKEFCAHENGFQTAGQAASWKGTADILQGNSINKADTERKQNEMVETIGHEYLHLLRVGHYGTITDITADTFTPIAEFIPNTGLLQLPTYLEGVQYTEYAPGHIMGMGAPYWEAIDAQAQAYLIEPLVHAGSEDSPVQVLDKNTVSATVNADQAAHDNFITIPLTNGGIKVPKEGQDKPSAFDTLAVIPHIENHSMEKIPPIYKVELALGNSKNHNTASLGDVVIPSSHRSLPWKINVNHHNYTVAATEGAVRVTRLS